MEFKSLEEYVRKPIPHASHLRVARYGWRTHPIDTAHYLYSEECVHAVEYGIAGWNYYHGLYRNPPYHMHIPGSIPYLLLRKSVAERLQRVNMFLAQYNLELFLFDAWRPQAVQRFCRNEWVPEALRKRFKNWTEEEVQAKAGQYWADGMESEAAIDLSSPPPHSTGAAVDLTIRARNGGMLSMGGDFDDVSLRSEVSFLELCCPDHVPNEPSFTDEEARANRRLLYHVMVDAGFAPNPNEWWHYSWEDQVSARIRSDQTGEIVCAGYSAVNPLGLP